VRLEAADLPARDERRRLREDELLEDVRLDPSHGLEVRGGDDLAAFLVVAAVALFQRFVASRRGGVERRQVESNGGTAGGR